MKSLADQEEEGRSVITQRTFGRTLRGRFGLPLEEKFLVCPLTGLEITQNWLQKRKMRNIENLFESEVTE